MNILGFFSNLALVEFRTKWIRIMRGPGVPRIRRNKAHFSQCCGSTYLLSSDAPNHCGTAGTPAFARQWRRRWLRREICQILSTLFLRSMIRIIIELSRFLLEFVTLCNLMHFSAFELCNYSWIWHSWLISMIIFGLWLFWWHFGYFESTEGWKVEKQTLGKCSVELSEWVWWL